MCVCDRGPCEGERDRGPWVCVCVTEGPVCVLQRILFVCVLQRILSRCAKLVQDFGFVHLSAGDLLRAEQKRGGERGDMIKNFIREGKIVPNEVTCSLLLSAVRAAFHLRTRSSQSRNQLLARRS